MKKTYDTNLMKTIILFESLTKAQAKDCFIISNTLYFVINPEHMGRAIGRNGQNIKRLESLMKKKIRIIEHSNELKTFIKNLIHPLTTDEIAINDGIVTLKSQDRKTKGILIGRNSANLNNYKDIIKRYFNINEIKVM